MKKFLKLLLVLAIATGTASAHGNRELDGTYLGVAKYKLGHNGPNKAALRIYLNEIEGERGSYHLVIHEYVNLLKMAPRYATANNARWINKYLIGFLKDITKKISVYKAVPTGDDHVLDLMPLKVKGDQIVAVKEAKPRQIRFDKGASLKDALAGAVITKNADGQPEEIFFPKEKDDKSNGIQYGIAKTVYEKIGLDSTWRKEFLPGPYLSAYGRLDDTVLKLEKKGSVNSATFVDGNPKYTKRSDERRQRMFTNKLSAGLEGSYLVTEPRDGMFLFETVESTASVDKVVTPRIGMFIDIFDATVALNQDVVELVMINPENPSDFLMYYEHPDNGEGN